MAEPKTQRTKASVAAFIAAERDKWAKVIKAANIQAQ